MELQRILLSNEHYLKVYILSKLQIDPEAKYKVFKELYYDKQSDIYLYKINRR